MRHVLLLFTIAACKEPPWPPLQPLGLTEGRADAILRGVCASRLDVRTYVESPETNSHRTASSKLVTCELRGDWGPPDDSDVPNGLVAEYWFDSLHLLTRFSVRANIQSSRDHAFAHHIIDEYAGDRGVGAELVPSLGYGTSIRAHRDGVTVVASRSPVLDAMYVEVFFARNW